MRPSSHGPGRGWLLDVHPDHARNEMVLWVKSGGRVRRMVDDFSPCIYVFHPDTRRLRDLGRRLRIVDAVGRTEVDINTAAASRVLAVHPRGYSDLKECARMIDSLGGYYDYQLYNVDVRLSQQYMISRGIYPLCLMDNGRPLEGQYKVDYRIPRLRTVDLRVKTSDRMPSMHSGLEKIVLGDMEMEGGEADILQGLNDAVRELDPDIIMTGTGDSFEMPFLAHKALMHDVELMLGREPENWDAIRQGKSYFSYGSILYKPPSYKLKGRLHFDRSSFILGEGGFHGLVDMARLSRLPLQTTARISPGTAISAMQVQRAMQDGYAIQWKKNRPEDFKTAEELLMADRGGMIFDPIVGIHDNIVEADFVSLYPNIMVHYNISPETLQCQCCPGTRRLVPELHYRICEKRVGLIPKVVEPLVRRRMAYKVMAGTRPEMAEMYKARASLLKWTLVTCFGYTGYKNARFGRIECHESINAYGRDIMVRSMEMAERFGYDVLHGIIDSLWLKPNGRRDHERACRSISRYIGIPLELEGVYRWILFLPNKGTNTGALNRYYGLFDTGEYKVRGIALRKSDTPAFVKQGQRDMLDVLSDAEDSAQFQKLMPRALEALECQAERLRTGGCSLDELVISKRISRELEEYRVFNDQVAGLRQLLDVGVKPNPGQRLRYVITDSESNDWRHRVRVADLLDGSENYDSGAYLKLLYRAGAELLAPFGYDESSVRLGQ